MEKTAELRRIEPRVFLLGEHLYLDSSDECYFANSYDCPQKGGVKPLVISLKQRDQTAVLKATEQLASLLPDSGLGNTHLCQCHRPTAKTIL